MKSRLFTPGPTPVPEHVMLRMAQPMIHHRTPEFRAALHEVSELLAYVFQTTQPVMTLTASGTGAMEAAIVNTLSAGDEVVFVDGGKFGQRWGEIARAYGLLAHEVAVDWGTAASADQLLEGLERAPTAKAVLLTQSETSTGVFTDVREIVKRIRPRFEGLVVVDGITAVGAHEMRFDEWDVDVLVTGSQKGLMIPPGLAFIALSARAWHAAESATLPRYYFDLAAAGSSLQKDDTPWTPAVTLVLGLLEALRMIRREGIEAVWSRHDRLAAGLRAGLAGLDLKLFGDPPSNAVTSVHLPERGEEFMKLIKEKYRMTIAAGQGHLKGKIFRVSHLGYYDEADMMAALYVIEQALTDVAHRHQPGAGLAAASNVYSHKPA